MSIYKPKKYAGEKSLNTIRDWAAQYFVQFIDLVAGKNITIDQSDGKVTFDVPDMRYDDSDLQNRVSTIEGKESSWNAKYDKPSTGIPKNDLANSVQSSLNKADSAIQEETDPTVPTWAKQPSKPSYTKSEVGLGNVDNTSDTNKPISTATQNALNLKANKTELDNYYTKDEIDEVHNSIADKLDEISSSIENDEDRLDSAEGRLDTVEGRLDTAEGRLNDIDDRISGDEDRLDSAEDRLDALESEVSGLDDITIPIINPTTTNFSAGEKYTIHTAIERVVNLFAGYWNYIQNSIMSIIPTQASPSNQLADKTFVNETVAQNAANFRGNWAKWSDVPTDVEAYPVDYTGNKTPSNNDYLVVTDASGYNAQYDGSWRFLYTGDWTTVGRTGWKPAYRIGSAFTDAQQAAIDSGITSEKVSTYDSYEMRIGANETNKVDKINTANKIYGTDEQGFQIGYEAGDNIQFTNGKISATDTIYDDSDLKSRVSTIEGKESSWNAKYDKPNTGIPKSDLESSVQSSLGKADSALQTETDPTVPTWAKQPTKPSYTKSEVGLGNVDNTSDLNKPISTATQNALNLKADKSQLDNYYTKQEIDDADAIVVEKINEVDVKATFAQEAINDITSTSVVAYLNSLG